MMGRHSFLVGPAIFALVVSNAVHGETTPVDPKAWRVMTLMDLQLVGPQQAFQAGIWSDLIAKNNAVQAAPAGKVARPASIGNAPVSAGFVTIRNAQVVVVLSILGAPRLCEPLASAGTVLRCPMRIIRFENGKSTMREGRGCFAAGKAGSNEPAAYTSYDTATRMIRLGVLSGSSAVEGCSQSVPVRESE